MLYYSIIKNQDISGLCRKFGHIHWFAVYKGLFMFMFMFMLVYLSRYIYITIYTVYIYYTQYYIHTCVCSRWAFICVFWFIYAFLNLYASLSLMSHSFVHVTLPHLRWHPPPGSANSQGYLPSIKQKAGDMGMGTIWSMIRSDYPLVSDIYDQVVIYNLGGDQV